MALREYICKDCEHVWETLVRNREDEPGQCDRCDSKKIEPMLSYPSNYTIKGNNSASVRPKRMGGGK